MGRNGRLFHFFFFFPVCLRNITKRKEIVDNVKVLTDFEGNFWNDIKN